MLNSDRSNGKVILILASSFFIYYTLWVIGLPFIDDSWLRSLFYSPNMALVLPAVSGLFFIGGLVIFTLYHLAPYLQRQKI